MIELPPDYTFVVQVISFLIFWQLMKYILFTPVQSALKARVARTSGDRAQAEFLRTEASALGAETESKLVEARLEASREADEVRRQAEAQEQEILGRARSEALALLERERAATEEEIEAARRPLRSEAERLASGVVSKVLGRAG